MKSYNDALKDEKAILEHNRNELESSLQKVDKALVAISDEEDVLVKTKTDQPWLINLSLSRLANMRREVLEYKNKLEKEGLEQERHESEFQFLASVHAKVLTAA